MSTSLRAHGVGVGYTCVYSAFTVTNVVTIFTVLLAWTCAFTVTNVVTIFTVLLAWTCAFNLGRVVGGVVRGLIAIDELLLLHSPHDLCGEQLRLVHRGAPVYLPLSRPRALYPEHPAGPVVDE